MALVSAQKMKKAIAHISSVDAKMATHISNHPLCTIGRTPSPETHFESLVSSVISQQLAIKAAMTIHDRLKDLSGGTITPAKVAKLKEVDLRAVGVSGAKAKTILGLCYAALSGDIAINELHLIDDDEVIFDQLTSLWGIGPWTVDMFMMFQLGRLDIWPTGDLGVRRGWERIHKLKEEIEPKALELKGEKFRPYRSVVAWYCWRAVDSK